MRRILLMAMVGSAVLIGCRGEPRIPRMAELDLPARPAFEPVTNRPSLQIARHVLTPEEQEEVTSEPPQITASTSYAGYDVARLLDGKLETSWFSAQNDSASAGSPTFVEVAFRRPRPLRKVVIMGNREPRWMDGFAIREGRLDVFDVRGDLVSSTTSAAIGDRSDFSFDLGNEVGSDAVSRVRFTSTSDDGGRNAWRDVAIAEILLE
ncbi:MAG: discoidin domain-containing protein [Polyangiaceae bacterium]